MRDVIILRGIPGSGKSTYARQLAKGRPARILSADDFFTTADGTYQFDAAFLHAAHKACLREYTRALGVPPIKGGLIVVDNTNTREAEITPYYALAEAYDWHPEVHQIDCPLDVAIARQIHGVPVDQIVKMHARVRSTLPSWWTHTLVPYASIRRE